jgi:uncharacterized membrane protein YedE/YeeE
MSRMNWLAVLLCGVVFGYGLSLATMVRPEVVLDFLLFRDFGLMLVLGGAVLVALLAYQLGPKWMNRPLLAAAFKSHRSVLDRSTLLGAAIFGLGWGISGVCPGPAITGLGLGNWPILYALVGIVAGAYVQGRWFSGSK